MCSIKKATVCTIKPSSPAFAKQLHIYTSLSDDTGCTQGIFCSVFTRHVPGLPDTRLSLSEANKQKKQKKKKAYRDDFGGDRAPSACTSKS